MTEETQVETVAVPMATEESGILRFRLEVYEGPLDLLLKLIAKNKVSIYDIPIALIFDEYMAYIEAIQKMDMEVAGEFVTMAAELMLIKSRMLLPSAKTDGSEEDPRAALAAALLAYKQAKEDAERLKVRYEEYGGRMIKETDEVSEDRSFVAPQQIESLMAAFERIARRRRLLADSMTDEPQKTLQVIVTAKVTPISTKVVGVLRHLKRGGRVPFEALMLNNHTRSDLVASFVAILQLIRRGEIMVTGETDDGDPILEINYDRRKDDTVPPAESYD